MKLRSLFIAALFLPCGGGAASAGTTLLLVDDVDINYKSGVERMLHQPAKHAANPLITGDRPRQQLGYSSLHRDPETGLYRMWYQISGGGRFVCYAESADGVVWTKPELNILSDVKAAPPNAVFTSEDHYGASVVVDAEPGPRKYKLAYWSLPRAETPAHPKDKRGPDGGMYVAFSSDGLHWSAQPGPVLRGAYGRSQEPPLVGEDYPWGVPASVSDVIDAFRDPASGKYVVYAKSWIDAPDGKLWWKRAIVRTESDDFIHWSAPRLVMAPDELDGSTPEKFGGTRLGVQLHGAPVFHRHGVYFSLVQVADFETDGLQPIELAVSRDGINWSRPFRSTPFLPTGKAGAFDAGRLWSTPAVVETGDSLYFYYGAYEHPWKFGREPYEWDDGKRVPKTGIGLAVLPLDRFAGLKPIGKVGQVTLRPRSLKGVGRITINAASANGATRVELLTPAGYRLPGFTKHDCVPVTDDGLRQAVEWRGASLASLDGAEVAIRVHLENSEIFSITLE